MGQVGKRQDRMGLWDGTGWDGAMTCDGVMGWDRAMGWDDSRRDRAMGWGCEMGWDRMGP